MTATLKGLFEVWYVVINVEETTHSPKFEKSKEAIQYWRETAYEYWELNDQESYSWVFKEWGDGPENFEEPPLEDISDDDIREYINWVDYNNADPWILEVRERIAIGGTDREPYWERVIK